MQFGGVRTFLFWGNPRKVWVCVSVCEGCFCKRCFSFILSSMCFGECCVFFAAICPTYSLLFPLLIFGLFHWVLCDPSRSGIPRRTWLSED